MLVHNPSGRDHRTALFIDVGEEARSTDGFLSDRVRRLLESVNGSNIKVDVYKVASSGEAGVVRVASIDEILDTAVDVGEFPASELSSWAAERGYTQVLISLPAGRGVV